MGIGANLPWDLPNSIRAMNPAMPLGDTMAFTGVDPTGQPATVTNQLVNFGWEYVWHCHLLGHEENDMMRPMILAIAPQPASNLLATLQGTGTSQSILVTWRDNSMNETAFTVQRATASTGPWTTVTTVPGVSGRGTIVRYTDKNVGRLTTYYYRIVANNVVGYTQTYPAPAVGYPHFSADSVPSTLSNAVTTR